MTRPYTDLTARIADESWSFGFDPRPLPFPAIRWALARVGYAAFIFGYGALLWVLL